MENLSQLDPEETRLVARFNDLARMAAQGGRPRFSSFLNERQQLLATETLGRRMLWGGYPEAVRRMLGCFPSWQTPGEEGFPLAPVTIWLPKGAEPSHRDVLGSLMSLQIGREGVGDILLDLPARQCYVFLQTPLVVPVVEDLRKIGGFGVRCQQGGPPVFVREDQLQPLRGTVSSVRMDALVSLLTGISREKSGALFRSQLVQRNDQVTDRLSGAFSPGDVITIRGYGKYRVEEIGPPTKKGRLPVLCSKYI